MLYGVGTVYQISLALVHWAGQLPALELAFLIKKEIHNAVDTLANYSPYFIIGSLTAYIISQKFDVWLFHYLKEKTNGKKLWLRNNVSTILSQLLDTIIYQATWVIATDVTFIQAFFLAITKYILKVCIALIDTIFIYWVRDWKVNE